MPPCPEDIATPEDEKMLAVLAADGHAGLVDLAAAALGCHARANLWLRVHPSAVKSAGRALAQEPEIAFAAAVSGPWNLHAVAHCRDLDELFEFTSDRIGSLTGLQSMEVSPVLKQVKQAGTRLFGDRLVEPTGARVRR